MVHTFTIHDLIQAARGRLVRAGIERAEAALDADVLARHALGGWERGQLIAGWREPAPPGFGDAFEALVRRRERREPSAYITGHREFWSIEIEVGPGVLIPRPETELLVEEALARASATPRPGTEGRGAALSIADVGTGSGCLAVALARWLPAARVVATDVSGAALGVARRNVERHGVADRVTLLRADLFDASPNGPPGADSGSLVRARFDVIVSNPPYVPAGDIARLQPEIRNHEPAGALDGGVDGLDVIRRLIPEAADHLAPRGWLLFEFGAGQADGVRAAVAAEPRLELAALREDLAGIPRVAITRLRIPGAPTPESRTPNP